MQTILKMSSLESSEVRVTICLVAGECQLGKSISIDLYITNGGRGVWGMG